MKIYLVVFLTLALVMLSVVGTCILLLWINIDMFQVSNDACLINSVNYI